MRFQWDEAKRQSNLQKHGFDFVDAPTATENVRLQIAPTITALLEILESGKS
jgi:uncharacterized DUF497 family protein